MSGKEWEALQESGMQSDWFGALVQVEDLARVSFKKAPLYIGVDDGRSKATVEGLEQGYCVVSSAQRFLLLFTFLKKNLKKKVRERVWA